LYKQYPELLTLVGDNQEVRNKLLTALQESWEALLENLFDKLVEFMQQRVRAVKKAKGWYTKY
jgi:hypothetical protein